MKRFTMERIMALVLALMMTLSLCPVTALAAMGGDGMHVCDEPDSYCLVCDVAEKINALPKTVDINNAADVTEQIHAIDRIKFDLSGKQYEELLTLVETKSNEAGSQVPDPKRYVEAVEAVTSLKVGGSLAIVKKYSVGDTELDWAKTNAIISIECIDTGSVFEPLSVTLADIGESSLTGFYFATSDGWMNRYILPAGTYRITETGYHAVTADGTELTTVASYSVNGSTTTNSAVVEVEEGGRSVVTVSNALNNHRSHYTCGVEGCPNADAHGCRDEYNWTKLTKENAINGTLTLEGGNSYYLGEDITVNSTVNISGTVTLCLNGKRLSLGDEATGSVIAIEDDATLNLCDCSNPSAGVITGGNVGNNGGGVYVGSGTFIMYGGTISGNTAEGQGGGVFAKDGTFTMHGGTISNNTAYHGGGGVYGAFKISGAPIISDNTSGSDSSVKDDNVYIPTYLENGSYVANAVITFGSLTSGAKIGVTLGAGTCTFTNGGAEYVAEFFSDNDAYEVTEDGSGNLKLAVKNVAVSGVTLDKNEMTLNVGDTEQLTASVLPENATDRTVTWSSNDGSIASVENGKVTAKNVGTTTITATAGGKNATCTVTVEAIAIAGSVILSGDVVYGSELTATYNGSETVDYQWFRGDEIIDGATENTYTLTTKDVGKIIKVVVSGTGFYGGSVSDETEKKVEKATPIVSAPDGLTATYGDTLANVLFLPEDGGAWSWKNGTQSVGNVGTNDFDAIYTPTDVDSYNTVEKKVRVTVNAKELTDPTIEVNDENLIYDGYEKTPAVTVKDGSTPLNENDYTVSYSNNIDAGKGKVTVTFKGNYSGSAEKEFDIAKKDQESFTIIEPTGNIAYGDSFTLESSGGFGDGDVTWAVTEGEEYAQIDNTGKVTITGVGEVTITATKAESTNYNEAKASCSFTTVKADQAKPDVGKTNETRAGKRDGKITGVDSTMEYRKSGDEAYTAITGETVENLSAGKYFVRYKEDENHNASPDATVTIAKGKTGGGNGGGGYPTVTPEKTPEEKDDEKPVVTPEKKPEVSPTEKPDVKPTTPPTAEDDVVTPAPEDTNSGNAPNSSTDGGAMGGTSDDDVPDDDEVGAGMWIAISLLALLIILLILVILIASRKRKDEQE